MKTCLSLLAVVALFGAVQTSPAQNPPSPGEKPDKLSGGLKEKRDRHLEALPEEMRARFKEVRDAAMQDPELQALKKKADEAGKEFREAMREAMMQRDPELAEKVRTYFVEHGKKGGDHAKARMDRQGETAKPPIPPEQRDRLEKAREIARQAPAVQSAEAKLKAATTPEDRREAGKEFHEAMRAAILTADPTLGEVLEKIRPPRPPKPTSSEPDPSGAAE